MFAESELGEFNSKYTRVSKLMVPFAHSPDIIYAPDTDQYVLIYVHNLTDNITPECTNCTDGYSVNCDDHTNMTEVTSIRWIDNLSDAADITKWSEPLLLDAIGVGDSNFAAQILKDGIYVFLLLV